MFRCKECGYEFDIKPEYCDCGNNTFDEIISVQNSKNPDIRQIISVVIFVLCLILAIIPWTIKSDIKQEKQVLPDKGVTSSVPAIPDIEKLWEDPRPKISGDTSAQVVKKEAQKVSKPVVQPIKQPVAKPVQKTPPNPVKPVPLSKIKNANQKVTAQKPPKVVEKVSQQVMSQTQSAKPQKAAVKTAPVDMTPLINYKNDLRIALLSKLNVPNIQGVGDCAVSFSVNSDGKLLNRSFVYKSSNKSVNDEVYYMLMRLPYFKKPPSIYKGETLKLKFYFNNGYYEISFL